MLNESEKSQAFRDLLRPKRSSAGGDLLAPVDLARRIRDGLNALVG